MFQDAVALLRQGLLDAAQALCEEILRLQTGHGDVLRVLAVIAAQRGDAGEAAALIQRANAAEPDHPSAVFYRASVLQENRQWAAALAGYARVLELDPNFADAYLKRGNLHYQLERWDAALADYEEAVRIRPDSAEAHFNRAVLLERSGRFDAAVEGYDRAVAIQADYAEAHYNRGILLHRLARWEAALASFDRAIACRPEYAEAHANRAVVQSELKQVDAALASCERAIALRDDYAEAHSNRGLLLQEIGRWDAALDSCDRAIELKPDYAEAYFNRSIVHLLHGNFAGGWADYEWRLQQPGAPAMGARRDLPQPRWLGRSSLAGKTLLVYAEQGLGDTLQFCRYVNLLADRGAHVLLQVQRPLARLLSRLPGAARVLTEDDPLPDFDCHCPLLSLPLAFDTELATIPATPQYLAADPALVARWRARLGERRRTRIGLMWRGNPANRRDRYRSLRLRELLPHLPATLQYVSLQKELFADDAETLRANPHIAHFPDQQDFDDAAALCECMDLVVSVDTSVAHLNCALGRTTWMVLPSTPDWRWLLERSDSPWYPTATLYRQEAGAGWGPVLERLRTDLLRQSTGNP